MKRPLRIQYFALLKEQAEKSHEIFETESKTAEALYAELATLYNFTLKPSQVRVAINDEFQDMDSALSTNDSVVFIPPVAGG